MKSRAIAPALLLLAACSTPPVPTPPSSAAPSPAHDAAVAPANAPSSSVPALAPSAADASRPVVPPPAAQKRISGPDPAARSCNLAGDALIAPSAEDIVLARGGSSLLALVVESTRKRLAVYVQEGERFVQRGSHTAEAEVRSIALAGGADGTFLAAYTDARGSLAALELDTRGVKRAEPLAQSVDTRFQPAVSGDAPAAVAYTQSVGEAMHTFVRTRSGATFGSAVDVTPLGHGAAAPTFAAGSKPRALFVIDARAGLSPLLEIPLPDAVPSAAIVRTPVSQPAAPPRLRAARWEGGEAHVLYTATGKLAATAIGHVIATRTDPPVAVVPSIGYGELRMDLIARPGGMLVAVEVPDDLPVTATRHVEVLRLDAQGEAPRFKLPAANVSRPTLAAGTEDSVWLGYRAPDGVHVAELRCRS